MLDENGNPIDATDNSIRPEDGDQFVSQSPDDDYSQDSVEGADTDE